jgi:hypothetical protein
MWQMLGATWEGSGGKMETRVGINNLEPGRSLPDDGLAAPCSDCRGLTAGTSSLMRPHQYLVSLRSSEDNGLLTYRGLLCRAVLSSERVGIFTNWHLASPPSI